MKYFIYILILFLFCAIDADAQKAKKPTYTKNGTTYFVGEFYPTTGKPKVKRNPKAVKDFLKSKGYTSVPKGYQVDHIIPLSEGGLDTPANMQLLTIANHKKKTATERKQSAGRKSKKRQK